MLLKTLGGLWLEAANFARPKPLLLLAYLSLEGAKDSGHLARLFWPSAGKPSQRLASTLDRLRQGAPGSFERVGAKIGTTVSSDASGLLAAFDAEDLTRGIQLYEGRFLDGLPLHNLSVELEEWVYVTREFIADRVRRALLSVAENGAERDSKQAARYAEQAYLLPGAAEPSAEQFRQLHRLLQRGTNPLAADVRREAESFGIELPEAEPPAPRQDGESPDDPVTTNLPVRLTSFVGRSAEHAELTALLRRADTHLLSLVGPGGSGKTRFALQLARTMQDEMVGVFFMPLETLRSRAEILMSMAAMLGLTLSGTEAPLGQIRQHLKDKFYLLVLDNFEHLIGDATLVSDLLLACPYLKVLVTSREHLNLTGELVYPVAGLELSARDEHPAQAAAGDAVQLFYERAKSADLRFILSSDVLVDVAEICAMVAGLPLAIELAAAWVRLMPVSEIKRELRSGIDILAGSARDTAARHRSVRAVLDASWGPLSERERAALRQLTVFKGGFRREAAAEVANVDLPLLVGLVNKSLVTPSPNGRYRLHPVTAQYLRGKLAEQSHERQRVEERHAHYYVRLAQEQTPRLVTAERVKTLETAEAEAANMKVAWHWAVDHKKAEVLKETSLPLGRFFENRPLEAATMFARAVASLDKADPEHLAASGYVSVLWAWFLNNLGSPDEALTLVEQGLTLLEPLGEFPGICKALSVKAWNLWFFHNEGAQARLLWEKALGLAREHRVENMIGETLAQLVVVELALGTFADVRQLADDTLAELNALGNRLHYTKVLCWSGDNLSRNGHLEEGVQRILEAVRLARAYKLDSFLPVTLFDAAEASYRKGDLDGAENCARECVRVARETGIRYAQVRGLNYLGRVMTRRGNYDQADRYLDEGLEIAWQIKDYFGITANLVSEAELRLSLGQTEKAAQWAMLVIHDERTEKHTRADAQHLLAVVKDLLAPEVLVVASKAGKSARLEPLVEQLLTGHENGPEGSSER